MCVDFFFTNFFSNKTIYKFNCSGYNFFRTFIKNKLKEKKKSERDIEIERRRKYNKTPK